MDKSSLRRVLRLSHLEDMHGSNAGVCASFVGSLWTLKVVIVAIRPWPRERSCWTKVGAGHVNGYPRLWLVNRLGGSFLPVAGKGARIRRKHNWDYKLYQSTVGCKDTKMRLAPSEGNMAYLWENTRRYSLNKTNYAESILPAVGVVHVRL